MIEILSPTTAGRDRGVKLKLYKQHGVTQYWIVDPDAEAIEVWTFGEAPTSATASATSDAAPGFECFTERLPVRLADEILGEIDLADVFRED